MYVCTDLSSMGVNETKTLIKQMAEKGIGSVCLVEDNGIGVQAFIEECQKYHLKTSICFKIESFIETREEKQTMLLFSSDPLTYQYVISAIQELKESFWPFITKKKAAELHKLGIPLFIEVQRGVYEEWTNKETIAVEPLVFIDEEEKKRFHWMEGVCLHDVKEDPYINRIASSCTEWPFQRKSIEEEVAYIQKKWNVNAVEMEKGEYRRYCIHTDERNVKLSIQGYLRERNFYNPIIKNPWSFRESVENELQHQKEIDRNFSRRIRCGETKEEFVKRNELLLLVDCKKKNVIEQASLWEGRRRTNPLAVDFSWVFHHPHCVKKDDVLYILEEKADSISLL